MALFKRAGDDRTMLEHVKSLMACDKKGGFALVEGVDWMPLTCLEEVRALSLSLSLSPQPPRAHARIAALGVCSLLSDVCSLWTDVSWLLTDE